MTDQREIEIEGAHILTLSPSGKWLTLKRGEQFCIYDVETLVERSCIDLGDTPRSIALDGVAWSPDSMYIAFTEDATKYFDESDLWLLEVESGKLLNLTDDGVTGLVLEPEPEDAEPLIDIAPTWSPDGKSLVFSRSTRVNDGWETALYSIPASGGKPEKLLTVTDVGPMATWLPPLWSQHGKRILYEMRSSDDTFSGIWTADQDGRNPRRILGNDPELREPFLLDVSDQADLALIWYPTPYSLYSFLDTPNVSYFALVDLKTGDVQPLKQDMESFGERNATFSPEGNMILYVYRGADNEQKLVVRDVDGETESILLTSKDTLGEPKAFRLGLDWVEDDTVYIATSRNSGLLLKLGTE